MAERNPYAVDFIARSMAYSHKITYDDYKYPATALEPYQLDGYHNMTEVSREFYDTVLNITTTYDGEMTVKYNVYIDGDLAYSDYFHKFKEGSNYIIWKMGTVNQHRGGTTLDDVFNYSGGTGSILYADTKNNKYYMLNFLPNKERSAESVSHIVIVSGHLINERHLRFADIDRWAMGVKTYDGATYKIPIEYVDCNDLGIDDIHFVDIESGKVMATLRCFNGALFRLIFTNDFEIVEKQRNPHSPKVTIKRNGQGVAYPMGSIPLGAKKLLDAGYTLSYEDGEAYAELEPYGQLVRLRWSNPDTNKDVEMRIKPL